MSRVHAPLSCRKSPGATSPTNPALPLVLPSAAAPDSLLEAARLVKEIWEDQAGYAEQTLERYGALVDRFARHAQCLGVSALAEVDPAVVKSWANSLGRDRRGRVVKPSAKTVGQRRAALAAFFTTAMAHGLTFDDPTPLVRVPKRVITTAGIRPLDPEEAVDVRYRAGTNPAEVRGVVVALMLAGAHSGELGTLERDNVQAGHVVRLPGSAKFSRRAITLDAEAAGLLAERAAYLAQRYPGRPCCAGKPGSPARSSPASAPSCARCSKARSSAKTHG